MTQSARATVREEPKERRRRSRAEAQTRIKALEAELTEARERQTATAEALREALEQQTAAAEVLGVINSSPGNLAPVFDAILQKGTRLCEAGFGVLWLYEDEQFRVAATHAVPTALAKFVRDPVPLAASASFVDLERGGSVVHVTDLAASELYQVGNPIRTAFVDLGGARTLLSVALRKDSVLLGTFNIYRQEVQPFTDKQIALGQNFAAQAVIAMENARLITETREALEQQTATADVLKAISRSTFDLDAVLQTVVSAAHRLCQSNYSVIFRKEGDQFRWAAGHGISVEYEERERRAVIRPGTDTVIGRAVLAGHAVQIADAQVDPLYDGEAENDARAMLGVPLLRDGVAIGGIGLARNRVEPFTDKQIELVTTFADQAVIAMENARLLGELQTRTRDLEESLEYQIATSDVLKVISQSTFDLQPVLGNVIDTALRLCRAHMGSIFRLSEGGAYRWAVGHGLEPAYEEIERTTPILPGPGTLVGRVALEGHTVQIVDARADPLYAPKGDAAIARARTMLGVPLMRKDAPIGVIAMARDRVEPFNDKEVALVSTFADQAVIAIENARLFNELRARTRDLEESLEYQTATSDVLQVISRSTFDLHPVLDTLLATAARICIAESGFIFRVEDGLCRMMAAFGIPPEYREFQIRNPIGPGRGTLAGRVAMDRRAVHIEDAASDPEYTRAEAVRLGNQRTMLGVPLIREDALVGIITLARAQVEPFSERQIELVRTFADQAVIAIENTRLLTELRESLEQQQAMAEVLGVINSSPGELQPVFDTMLGNATRLCGATFGLLWLYDSERFRAAALYGVPEKYAEWLQQPVEVGDSAALAEVARLNRSVHISDLLDSEAYRAGNALRRATVNLGRARTGLAVPLCKDDVLLGIFVIYRQEVRPFSDKQIALLESFSAQAVIAMDNARLLGEIRQRQAELRVTFDNMGDGVAMFDAELRLAAWNRIFQQILDLPNDFVAGRPSFAEYFRYLAARGEYPGDLEAELSRNIADTQLEMRFERERPDGRVIEVRRTPVPGGGFVLIYSDVTERKRAEAEIRAARDAAEKALAELRATQQQLIVQQKMAALGQLTAGIAHEIKNPLNFVNNFAGLSVELLDELRNAAAPGIATLDATTRAEIDETVAMLTGNLEKIAEHGRRADGIVKSMLEHSRGGSGDWRSVDMNSLVEEALNLAYHGARAQNQSFNITMERDLDTNLAPIEVVPQDVTRVFLNLIGNGFYAAAKRRLEMGAGFRPLLKVTTRDLGDAVEVRVRDNGTGIAPEIRDKLFQPFFTTKPTGEGTGLGLSISYDIVTQQHGGSMAVDSEVAAFTEFTVRLPRQRRQATERAA